jgi:hypothetical protein
LILICASFCELAIIYQVAGATN